MLDFSDTHKLLREEWVETPPDVSYRFVVSLRTLRAAEAASRAFQRRKKISWWRRAVASFVPTILRFVVGSLLLALYAWLSLQPARIVDRALGTTPHSELLPIITFLVSFVGLLVVGRIALLRFARLPIERLHGEFFADNEFLLEGRKSHLWFDEQSAGSIRRWSTFEQILEFEDGMWLFQRRRRTFAGLRGLLISKDSLPGSCAWNELRMYLSQRIEEEVRHEAEVKNNGQHGRL
jgi:hypothetical protein